LPLKFVYESLHKVHKCKLILFLLFKINTIEFVYKSLRFYEMDFFGKTKINSFLKVEIYQRLIFELMKYLYCVVCGSVKISLASLWI